MKKGDLQSQTIDSFRFLLLMGVVMIHAYSSTRLQIDSSAYPFYRWISFFFSLELAQVAVPGFFCISGFLAHQRYQNYATLLKSRIYSVGIPYVVWIGITLVLYFVAEGVPMIAEHISGNQKAVRDYVGMDFLRAFWDGGNWDGGNGTPLVHQFWYLRNLLLLLLIYPLLSFFVRKTGWLGISIFVLIWLFIPRQSFLIESIALFSTGIGISIHYPHFLPYCRKYVKPAGIAYLCLVFLNLVLREVGHYILPLDRVSFLLGIFLWPGILSILLEKKKIKIKSSMLPLSFFIFVLHDPMITGLKRLLMGIFHIQNEVGLVLVYFAAPAIVVLTSMGVYFFLDKYIPWLLHILVGRRTSYGQK